MDPMKSARSLSRITEMRQLNVQSNRSNANEAENAFQKLRFVMESFNALTVELCSLMTFFMIFIREKILQAKMKRAVTSVNRGNAQKTHSHVVRENACRNTSSVTQ